MDSAVVHPCGAIRGTVRVPGDKSISHRVAMLSAMASGTSSIRGFLASEDCINTLKAVERLGANVSLSDEELTIRGTGGVFVAPAGPLDLGNSGTSMRLLAGILAARPFTVELTGDASLRSRPMGRIKDPLERMGAKVELLGERGAAPMRITGGPLRGIDYALPVASAQVKSCVLLAAVYAEGTTLVTEPRPTRDHTEKLFMDIGIPVIVDGPRIRLQGFGPRGPALRARRWTVPGDFSSAAFWITAAACREGARVKIQGVGLNPRRTALIDVLKRMGADISVSRETDPFAGEPRGGITVRGAALNGTEVGGDEIPNLIDELPLVAAAGALARGRTVIRDAAELRIKESDRIATMAGNLARMGVGVEEQPDGMVVEGPTRVHAAGDLDSRGDHRVAMAMTVLSLFADGPVRINDVACVGTSYPSFWEHLESLGGHAERHRGN